MKIDHLGVNKPKLGELADDLKADRQKNYAAHRKAHQKGADYYDYDNTV